MNLLSLLRHEYVPDLTYNRITDYFEMRFRCNRINDTDCYNQLTKDDLCVLKDNAKRIYDEIKDYYERVNKKD